MKRWFNLCIVFALIFGGGLALSLGMFTESVLLFGLGASLGFVWNKRNLLPE